MIEPMQHEPKRYLVICNYMFRIMWWLPEWLHSAGVLQFYSITITMPALDNNSIHHTCNLQVFIKTFPSQGTSTRFFWAFSTQALFFINLFLGLGYILWSRCWWPWLRFSVVLLSLSNKYKDRTLYLATHTSVMLGDYLSWPFNY
jgi:hypothetical protein